MSEHDIAAIEAWRKHERDNAGDIIKEMYEQLNPDNPNHAAALVLLQMAEIKVRRGTYNAVRIPIKNT